MKPEILPSARKRGIADADVLHALRNAVHEFPNQGDYELTIAVGPARNGVRLLEVGFAYDDTGRLIVVHVMDARRKYLRGGVI